MLAAQGSQELLLFLRADPEEEEGVWVEGRWTPAPR